MFLILFSCTEVVDEDEDRPYQTLQPTETDDNEVKIPRTLVPSPSQCVGMIWAQ